MASLMMKNTAPTTRREMKFSGVEPKGTRDANNELKTLRSLAKVPVSMFSSLDSSDGCDTFRRGMLPSRHTFIEHGPYRFLITDSPSQFEMPSYTETLRRYGVRHVVRVCESTYDSGVLTTNGFKVHDWEFEDGGVPTPEIVEVWIDLLDAVFATCRDSDDSEAPAIPETIAVHCRSGLGRAPVLVCLALIEAGMEPIDAIGGIRTKRRGAISSRQVQELIRYKKRVRTVKPVRSNSLISLTKSKLFGRRRRSSGKIDEIASPVEPVAPVGLKIGS